jgi:hypothetical protein
MRMKFTVRLRKFFLSVPLEEASFDKRGFRGGNREIRERVEEIGRAVLSGYGSALEEDRPSLLGEQLDRISPELRGFAYEGAAMALALLDDLSPSSLGRSRRTLQFLRGPAAPHVYMSLVGVGWAAARFPLTLGRRLEVLDPVLRWLVFDGYGFHEGFFHWARAIDRQEVPRRMTGYRRRAFDQGLGRSLWFVEGADVERIAAAVARFPAERHGDLWSGVGLAGCYAGGVDRQALEALRGLAGDFRPQLAQGAAFAAKARILAGNPVDATELACDVWTSRTPESAARVTDEAALDLSSAGPLPAYELWRQRIQARLSPLKGAL